MSMRFMYGCLVYIHIIIKQTIINKSILQNVNWVKLGNSNQVTILTELTSDTPRKTELALTRLTHDNRNSSHISTTHIDHDKDKTYLTFRK